MRKILIIHFSIVLLLLACSNTNLGTTTMVASTAVVDSLDTQHVEELPLPDVPVALTEPSARASYIIAHFWDAMDFCDTLRSHNSAFMEQNFSNFVSVFPYADEQARREAVSALLSRAAADAEAYRMVASIAEDYLYDPNSPVFAEDTYLLFLEQMVNSAMLDEARATRLKRQLRFVRLNRAGMTAADFGYVTREGIRTRLSKTNSESRILLLFYDPDCEHCKEVMAELSTSSLLERLVDEGKLKVVAIYADGDTELWRSTYNELPASWTVGMDTGEIYERGLYSLRAMPTMYLLDADKTVILKDVSIAHLVEYLSK